MGSRAGAAGRRRLRIAVLTGATVLVAASTAACGGGGGGDDRPTTGAGIYRQYCLTCHGADGQGGVGPALAGRMIAKYPDIADQINVVANGTGRMPAFRGNLSTSEIRKVVEYERNELGQ